MWWTVLDSPVTCQLDAGHLHKVPPPRSSHYQKLVTTPPPSPLSPPQAAPRSSHYQKHVIHKRPERVHKHSVPARSKAQKHHPGSTSLQKRCQALLCIHNHAKQGRKRARAAAGRMDTAACKRGRPQRHEGPSMQRADASAQHDRTQGEESANSTQSGKRRNVSR